MLIFVKVDQAGKPISPPEIVVQHIVTNNSLTSYLKQEFYFRVQQKIASGFCVCLFDMFYIL